MRNLRRRHSPAQQAAPAVSSHSDEAGQVTFTTYADAPKSVTPAPGRPWPAKWTSAKIGRIGYLTGRGLTAPEIARELDDGTSRETIRGQWRRWGLPVPQQHGRRCSLMTVVTDLQTRALLTKRAAAAGVDPDEYVSNVIRCVTRDDLYRAVVDAD